MNTQHQPQTAADLLADSPLNVTVSLYENYRDNVGTKCNLFAFLTTAKYCQRVTNLRTFKDKKERNALKAKMPCVTVSGLFDKRNLKSVNTPTNLICLDFDNVTDLVGLFEYLKTLPFIAFAAYSASGLGIYAVVPIENAEKHEWYFNALAKLFLVAGYEVDKACKDITRLRLASYDATPYINHKATTYTDTEKTLPTTATTATTRKAVQRAHPPSNALHATTNATTAHAIQIAINAAANKGLQFRTGERTSFIVFVAGYLNRMGIGATEAYCALDSVFDISAHPEHKARFFDVYSRYAHEHNTPPPKKEFLPLRTNPQRIITYDRFLNDSPDFEDVCREMLNDKRRLWTFEAPTRAGKTHAFTRDFVDILTALHPTKIVVFLNPLRATKDQVTTANPILNTNPDIFAHSCFTWDKGLRYLKNHSDRLKDIVLIIDEGHDLIKAANANYKGYQIGKLNTFFASVCKVILLSGTPFGIMQQLGFTTIKAQPTTPTKYNVVQITTDKENIPVEIMHLLKTFEGQKNLIFCRAATSTEKTSAESLTKLANKCGLISDFVFSGNKLSSPTSQHIIKNGTLPDEINNVFCTAVFETGVTVKADNIIIINEKPQVDFVGMWQSISRNTTDNTRNVTVITVPIKENEYPKYDFDFEQLLRDGKKHQDFADIFTTQRQAIERAIEQHPDLRENYKLPALPNDILTWCDTRKTYTVCAFVLLQKQYKKIINSYTHTDLTAFLEQYTGAIVTQKDSTNAAPNKEIANLSTEIQQAAKAQKETAKTTIADHLSTPPTADTFLKSVAKETDNAALKNTLRVLGCIAEHNTPPEQKTLYQQNIKLCETAASRYSYLDKKFLKAISPEILSRLAVSGSYDYGKGLERLCHIAVQSLIDIYDDKKIENCLTDDRAPQTIAGVRLKNECLAALQAAQQAAPLTVCDALKIVQRFNPDVKRKGLNSYLMGFCQPTTTRTHKARYLSVEALNSAEYISVQSYTAAFTLFIKNNENSAIYLDENSVSSLDVIF